MFFRNQMTDYRSTLSIEKRKSLFMRLSASDPDRHPVIIEPSQQFLREYPRFKSIKLLMDPFSKTNTIISHIRYANTDVFKSIEHRQLFIFAGNHNISMHDNLGKIYKSHKDSDGFLYITVYCENTFG